MAKKKEQGSSAAGFPFTSDLLKIADKLDLPTSERHLLHLLRSYLNEKEKRDVAFPGQVRLAKEMGVTKRQVIRLIKSVAAKGIISVAIRKKTGRKHGNNSNEYAFNYPWRPVKSDKPKVTSVSPIKSDICDKPKVTSETVKSDICDKSKVTSCHPNNIIGINKGINQSSISQGKTDDDSAFLIGLGLPEGIANYYKSINPVDLTERLSSGKRADLLHYIRPFTESGSKLRKMYGTDYSAGKPKWWESEFDKFYKKATDLHWETTSNPGRGFRVQFRRAAVSGVLSLYGFEPRSPAQQKAEKQEAERRKAQEAKREKAKRKKELAEKEKRERKDQNLTEFYQDLIKDDSYIEECMYHLHYISESGKLNREMFRALIKELRDTGKVKKKDSRETWIAKLREAIIEERGPC